MKMKLTQMLLLLLLELFLLLLMLSLFSPMNQLPPVQHDRVPGLPLLLRLRAPPVVLGLVGLYVDGRAHQLDVHARLPPVAHLALHRRLDRGSQAAERALCCRSERDCESVTC